MQSPAATLRNGEGWPRGDCVALTPAGVGRERERLGPEMSRPEASPGRKKTGASVSAGPCPFVLLARPARVGCLSYFLIVLKQMSAL